PARRGICLPDPEPLLDYGLRPASAGVDTRTGRQPPGADVSPGDAGHVTRGIAAQSQTALSEAALRAPIRRFGCLLYPRNAKAAASDFIGSVVAPAPAYFVHRRQSPPGSSLGAAEGNRRAYCAGR